MSLSSPESTSFSSNRSSSSEVADRIFVARVGEEGGDGVCDFVGFGGMIPCRRSASLLHDLGWHQLTRGVF